MNDPLHFEALNNIKNLEDYLKAGGDPNQTTGDNWSLLHTSVYGNHADFVELLLKHKANPSIPTLSRNQPLHYAAAQGHCHLIRILLEAGAEPDTRALDNHTPLYDAFFGRNLDCADLLLSSGAKLSNLYRSWETFEPMVGDFIRKRQSTRQCAMTFIFAARKHRCFRRDIAKWIGTMIWESRMNDNWQTKKRCL